MKLPVTLVSTAILGSLSGLGLAGEPPLAASTPEAGEGSMFRDFDFCSWISGKPGTVYKNPGNPWLGEVQFFGRFHWNAAYIDGEGIDGRDFSGAYTDARRFRLGAKIGFLNYFTAKPIVNLVDDARFNGGELDWGYDDFDEFVFSFDAQRAFNVGSLDVLTLNYGRFKWHGGLEARTSSNELLTVERSALSNKLYQSARPTGFAVNAVKGPWNLLTGIYSSDERTVDGADANPEAIGGWNDDLLYNLEIVYSATDDLRLGWEFLYNHADEVSEDSILDYRWASTLSAEYAIGNGGINLEGFYGDNGDERLQANATRRGHFWGIVATPYYWIVPAKLQAVVQYTYAGSEEAQGVRTNSRYFRATGSDGGSVNGGRGDSLHTVYTGLNYLICGDNLKVQGGLEYTHLDTPNAGSGSADALTWLFGFRTSF